VIDSPSRDHVQALRDYVADSDPVTGRHRRVPLLVDHLMILGRVVIARPEYVIQPAILATLQALSGSAWDRAESLAARHDDLMTRAALDQAERLAVIAGSSDADEVARAALLASTAGDLIRRADALASLLVTRPPRRPRTSA